MCFGPTANQAGVVTFPGSDVLALALKQSSGLSEMFSVMSFCCHSFSRSPNASFFSVLQRVSNVGGGVRGEKQEVRNIYLCQNFRSERLTPISI